MWPRRGASGGLTHTAPNYGLHKTCKLTVPKMTTEQIQQAVVLLQLKKVLYTSEKTPAVLMRSHAFVRQSDPEAALRNSDCYRIFRFRSSRGHTFQTRLTGSASARQFGSADRQTTLRGFARLLKHPKSLNCTAVSATRAPRFVQCVARTHYPVGYGLFLHRLLSTASHSFSTALASPTLVLRQPSSD
jgi:hypothetical protein